MKALLICPAHRPAVAALATHVPLAAAPLLGGSLLEYWLVHLAGRGVREVTVLAADRFETMQAIAGDGARWGLRVDVRPEPRELTPDEARVRYCGIGAEGWLPPPDDITVLDHLPDQPEHCVFESYGAWFAAAQTWMENALTPVRVGVHEIQPGLRVGLHSRVPSNLEFEPPCWIGENVYLGAGVRLGPMTVIEDRAFIEGGAVIARSIIGPETFVGELAEVRDSIAWGDTLINWRSGKIERVRDTLVVGPLRPTPAPPDSPRRRLSVERLLASLRRIAALRLAHALRPRLDHSAIMKAVLPLFVFVDACGWEIIRDDPFALHVAPHRRRLRSVFGFSSACIPSILSGRWPAEHRNWCYFVHDPAHSPFRALRPLRWLPRAITGRRIFRRWLSKFLRGPLKFRGYFDLYNIPFEHVSLFDFSEKKNPLQPRGLNRGPNIFDFLGERSIPYHVSDPARSEAENLAALLADVRAERIDFSFLYWPDLDGLLHRVGNQSPEVPAKLRDYDRSLRELVAAAEAHYHEVRLYLFSDHGMANCDELLDLRAQIAALPVRMPRDYAVVYDSTMARFWFFNAEARQRIAAHLQTVPQGRILSDFELEQLGTNFPDRHFGELIFLVREGVLIVPSDMGERPIRAMHGYHPDEKHSYASLLTNHADVPDDITDIPHIYSLMTRDAELAHATNAAPTADPARTPVCV